MKVNTAGCFTSRLKNRFMFLLKVQLRELFLKARFLTIR